VLQALSKSCHVTIKAAKSLLLYFRALHAKMRATAIFAINIIMAYLSQ
jgi:hypothetical protein